MTKEFFNLLAIILTIAAFFPYIRSIQRGQTIPHVFSWIIWGLTTTIVFFAQLAGGAGIGAWSIGFSGVITFYIAWMAYRRKGDSSVTMMDWVFFILSMASLPLWFVTRDPFWAVVILTTVDTLGFGPTFRKAYHKPYEEQLLLYVLMAIRNLVSIPALENLSWTTALFPVILSLTCFVFVLMAMIRRFQVPPAKA